MIDFTCHVCLACGDTDRERCQQRYLERRDGMMLYSLDHHPRRYQEPPPPCVTMDDKEMKRVYGDPLFEGCEECGGTAFHQQGCKNYYGKEKTMTPKDVELSLRDARIEELEATIETYKRRLGDMEEHERPVGWVANLQQGFGWGPSEVIFARSRLEALHLACNALEIDWDDLKSSDFTLARETRLDEYKAERNVPPEVLREVGFMEEGSSTCDTCGLGTLWTRKDEYIGEVCEACNQCDDCGCLCCPVCKDDFDGACEACGGEGTFDEYLKLKRRIRVYDDGEFEGVVWTPGQPFPNLGDQTAELVSEAVRDFAKRAHRLGDAFIRMDSGLKIESIVAEVLLVSQVDEDVIVRGRIVGPSGKMMKEIWDLFPSPGVVPFNVCAIGEGYRDSTRSELTVTGFEIRKEEF